MALPTIGDGEQIGDGNLNETLKVGRPAQPVALGGSGGTVGLYGATPAAQAAYIATVTASTTLTQMVVVLNSVLAALKTLGVVATA